MISLSFFTSCGKSDVPEILVESRCDFIIKNTSTLVTTYAPILNVPVFYNTTISNNSLDDTNAEVLPYSCIIRGAFADIPYDFLQDIAVYAVSIKNPTVKKEMFYLENIPYNQGPILELFPSINNLKDIMQEDIIDIEVRVNLKKFVPLEFISDITFKYSIN
jgi:hypothetical protein